MKQAKEIFMYALGALLVVGFFTIIIVIFKAEMPQSNKDIGLLVIGALVAKFGDVVNYFFGSSKGSSEKTDIISKQQNLNK